MLMVGLIGTAVSCLGVAFATSFAQAVFWRSFGGVINGTVGIIRTMIAENVKEKKYHSRAFLILPIGFNIAALFGPGKKKPKSDETNKKEGGSKTSTLLTQVFVVLGGLLSDPLNSYPRIFGSYSPLGGADGAQWLERFPYALPDGAEFLLPDVVCGSGRNWLKRGSYLSHTIESMAKKKSRANHARAQ